MAKKKKTKKMWELTPDEWIDKFGRSISKNGFEQDDFFNEIQDEIIKLTSKIDDLDDKLDELAEIEEERELTDAEAAQYDRLLQKSDLEHDHFVSLYTSLTILLNLYLMYAFSIPEKMTVMISNNIMEDMMDDDLFSLIMKHVNIFFSYYLLMTRGAEPDFEKMEERNEELFCDLDDDLSDMIDSFLNDEDFDDEDEDEDDEDDAPPILS